jgi:hypothetical protein
MSRVFGFIAPKHFLIIWLSKSYVGIIVPILTEYNVVVIISHAIY